MTVKTKLIRSSSLTLRWKLWGDKATVAQTYDTTQVGHNNRPGLNSPPPPEGEGALLR